MCDSGMVLSPLREARARSVLRFLVDATATSQYEAELTHVYQHCMRGAAAADDKAEWTRPDVETAINDLAVTGHIRVFGTILGVEIELLKDTWTGVPA